MATPIKPKRTFTSGKVPTTADLQDGEMGINVPDGRIYVRQGSNVALVGSKEKGVVEQIIGSSSSNSLSIAVSGSLATPQLNIGYPSDVPTTHVLAGIPLIGGTPQFRALTSMDIPQLDASKISSGTLSTERIPWPQDYIKGFYISTSAGTITVSAGSAYVTLAGGTVVESPGATITSSTAANTTYHLYLDGSGGISRYTTAPGAPYYLTARRRGSVLNSRYLGSVRTDANGMYILQNMITDGNHCDVMFLNNTSLNTVLINGTSSTTTDVSLASYAPITTVRAHLLVRSELGTAGTVRIFNYDGSGFSVWGNLPYGGSQSSMTVATDSTPKIRYDVIGGGGATIFFRGYVYAR